ncbi:MAG: cell division ATP-binding protein FtsE [Armatimonadia bacterium]|nr:cell division ATP-binding protein FtsE [Armatimonadia bacterium]
MIEFVDVSLQYPNGTQALDRVSLTIQKGEFCFLVGPSGTGKSSLLKLVYREETPTGGQVVVADTDVAALPRRHVPLLRRRIGVVFQDFRLLTKKTAAENVGYALDVIGLPRREKHRRVPKALELVDLVHKADAYPDELSGGEQQRVSIARALVNNPPILVADEPTGNLDPDASWNIIQLLSKINIKGTTVVVATHDRDIVNRMARRVVTMADGRVVADRQKASYDHSDEEPEEQVGPSDPVLRRGEVSR